MKYQSELIKEIVDSRGHKESSLHYESECTETWIEEAKGAYPKLCDYESEWLKYISVLDDTGGSEDPEPPIGEFPYVVLSDVTEATIDNVVPYAYKSAILKGDTLVNVVSEQCFGGNSRIYESRFFDSPFNANEKFTIFVVNPDVTTIKVGLNNAASGNWEREQQYNIYSNKRVVYTVPAGYCCKYVAVVVRTDNDASGFENSLVIVSGDKSNLEIDNYFEGMLSVQTPVLTTSNTEFLTTLPISFFEENTPESISGVANFKLPRTFNDVTIKCKVNGLNQLRLNYNKSVTISNNDLKNGIEIKVDSLTDIGFHGDGIAYATKGDLIKWLKDGIIELAINEKGSKLVDGYKIPYISNILTVNENVVLRGIGDVKDELDLLTGKLTQRIDEDGSALTQEVVRTVDLNIQDQNGKTLSVIKPIEGKMFVSTSSDTIKPLFSGEIPVEAITQNLASFIDLEMEE